MLVIWNAVSVLCRCELYESSSMISNIRYVTYLTQLCFLLVFAIQRRIAIRWEGQAIRANVPEISKYISVKQCKYIKQNQFYRLSTDFHCTTTCSANNFTRYTNGGGERGGSGDGSGGDPVEEEPALPVQLSVLGRLNLLVQLRGFDICKWDSVNFDWSLSSSSACARRCARRCIAHWCSL